MRKLIQHSFLLVNAVFMSQISLAADKDLYFSIPTTNTTRQIQRTQPTGASSTNTQTITNAATADFPLSPSLAASLSVSAGNHSVIVRMACNNRCGNAGQRARTIAVSLQYGSGASWTTLGSQSQSFTIPATGYTTYTYTINVASNTNVASGQELRVLIANNSGTNNANVTVVPLDGGIYSKAVVSTSTFINVDSTTVYSATYPSASTVSYFNGSQTAYIRGVVSDPFGSFDITSATITLRNPSNTAIVTNAAMTMVNDSGTNTKTYQYAYTLPASPALGEWTYTITANEGAEGTVSDTIDGTMQVGDPSAIPDLTTSTKDVVDLNGGEANVGDVLRYTVSVINTSATAASGVSVADNIPALLGSLSVVSTPAGSTNSSTGAGTGTFGNGFVNITNITVPGNSTVTVVYDVTISLSANPGDVITNSATVTPAVGSVVFPVAPSVTVSPSQTPVSGNKDLYLSIPTAGTLNIQRTRPTGAAASNTEQVNSLASSAFDLTPVLQKNLVVASGASSVVLRLACATSCNNAAQRARDLTVTLQYGSGASWTTLGSDSQSFTMGTLGTYATYTFNINVGANTTVPSGQQLRLLIANTTATLDRNITIMPLNGGIYSRAIVNSNSVINVDSAVAYSQVYPSTATTNSFDSSTVAYIRAVVSDPFGSFDISGATLVLTDPSSTVVVNGAAMTLVADSGTSTKTYEYQYTIPSSGPAGEWSFVVTATEGVEGTISDTGMGTFKMGQFNPTIVKSSSVLSDGVSGSNYKRISGAVIQHNMLVTNTGLGQNDSDSLVLTLVVPTDVTLCVSATCAGASDPVQFSNGTPSSGLSFTYGTAVTYSNQPGGGAPYNYTPSPDGSGYDSAVRGIRIAPSGMMNGSSGSAPHPNFNLIYRSKIK